MAYVKKYKTDEERNRAVGEQISAFFAKARAEGRKIPNMGRKRAEVEELRLYPHLEEIRQMLAAGARRKEIAERLGTSLPTLRCFLRRAGIGEVSHRGKGYERKYACRTNKEYAAICAVGDYHIAVKIMLQRSKVMKRIDEKARDRRHENKGGRFRL